jgi:acyl dehydratase
VSFESADGQSGMITDEALAQLQSRIGKEYPINEPFIQYINADSTRHMAVGLGDDNPLWLDRSYARNSVHRAPLAPPAILYGAAWGAGDMRRGEGLPGVHSLHCGDRWTWLRPLVDGDVIHTTRVLTRADLREGAYGGNSVLQVREFRFYDTADELVATCEMSAVRAERSQARSRGKYAAIEMGVYTSADIDAIDGQTEAEVARGAVPRLYGHVAVGEQLPPLVRGPLTIGDMLVWHMAAGPAAHVGTGRQWWDMRRRGRQRVIVHPESGVPQSVQLVHMDADLAYRAAGMPAPYDIGAQRGAWTTVLFTNWIGDSGFLACVDMQYRAMNFLNDVTWWHSEVVDMWRSATKPHGFVECAVEAVNQRGELNLKGSAVCVLPLTADEPLSYPIHLEPKGEPASPTDREEEDARDDAG